MTKFLSAISIGILGLLIAAPMAAAEGDAEKGKAKFVVCAACHGPNGEGIQSTNAPRLAGQNSFYIRRQLKNFKEGTRGTTSGDQFGVQMPPMAATLTSDQDIEDVIAYLQTLKPEPLPETVTGGDAAKGKEIYVACAACHGADGMGIEELSSPRVAGIPDWYIKRQIENFDKGIRGTHQADVFGHQMGELQKVLLSDEQAILDVVAYINSLPKN